MAGDHDFLRKIQKAIQNVTGTEPEVVPKKEPEAKVIKSVQVEEQKAVEIIYKPDEKDVHGEWMSEETIIKGEQSFQDNEVVANLFHLMETDQFEITKSWVLEEDTDFDQSGEVKSLKKGTWLAETHYSDPTLWELKKSGEIGGLSLGGYGDVDAETGEITNLCFSAEEYKNLHEVEAE